MADFFCMVQQIAGVGGESFCDIPCGNISNILLGRLTKTNELEDPGVGVVNTGVNKRSREGSYGGREFCLKKIT